METIKSRPVACERIILGIDPGTTVMGFGVLSVGGGSEAWAIVALLVILVWAACAALCDVLPGRAYGDVGPHLGALWRATLRATRSMLIFMERGAGVSAEAAFRAVFADVEVELSSAAKGLAVILKVTKRCALGECSGMPT
jgi:hypothetical protein